MSIFTLLHAFTGSAADGQSPTGALLLSGSKLYGLSPNGGANGIGTAFSMNLNGSGFTLLHSFDGSGDGQNPHGSLTLLGSKLYGMAQGGGSGLNGTIFSMNLDGTGFQVLYQFTGSTTDGGEPNDSLIASGTKLYGMTADGGSISGGVAFSINSDGSDFTILEDFTDENGFSPEADLTLSADSQTLYGMTPSGGDSGNGVVFSLPTDVPEPAGIALLTFGGVLCATRRRRR